MHTRMANEPGPKPAREQRVRAVGEDGDAEHRDTHRCDLWPWRQRGAHELRKEGCVERIVFGLVSATTTPCQKTPRPPGFALSAATVEESNAARQDRSPSQMR